MLNWLKRKKDTQPRCYEGWRINADATQKTWVEEHVGPTIEVAGKRGHSGVRDVWRECLACGKRL